MVAASDDTGVLSVRAVVLCLVIIVAGLVTAVLLGERINPLRRTPFRESPQVNAAQARALAGRLGYDNVADSDYGLFTVAGLEDYGRENLPRDQYEDFIRNARTSPVRFWYRQSPRDLDTLDEVSPVTNNDPPPTVPGMVNIEFDADGRLVWFSAVPPQAIADAQPRAVDWSVLFEAAGLQQSQWVSAPPRWIPLAGFDTQAGWTGSFPHAPSVPIQIDAAAWKGRVVQFQVRGPWALPSREAPRTPRRGVQGRRYLQSILLWSVTLGAVLLAAGHYRRGRGDRGGATRLAAFAFACGVLAWLLSTHHVGALRETLRIAGGVGSALTTAAFFWIVYMALEPIVRRRWPQSLISWTRLLNGAVRDPVVAGHVLVGLAVGIGLSALVFGIAVALDFRLPQNTVNPSLAVGAHRALAVLLGFAGGETTGVALGLFFLFFLVRTLLKRTWAAIAVAGVVFWLFGFFQGGWGQVFVPLQGLFALAVLTRFGLLPLAVMIFVARSVGTTPMTTALSDWDAASMLAVLATLAAVTAWCFNYSLGGRKLLKIGLLD
jgi:serine/threonine-protein kinase